MSALGSLWYTLGIDSKQIDADLKSVEAKLKNLGVTVDVSKVRQTIEASVGATPFNATVNFGNARASLDAIFANKKYDVHVEAIASKLHESIRNALANFSTGANILPKKKELRKAVNDALLSAGFEINIGKVKGLNATINNALGSAHTLNVSVDPKKLASAIDKAVGAYKGGKQVSVEVKDKILKDSITTALKTEKFPIRVIVDKAEAQDAVRQALQAAGLQSRTGFTASDKRAWDAQSRRMEAEARAAAASALAQRRLAGARSQATNAADKHTTATISLNSALKGNITLTKELGGAIGAAYSVVALKNFMTKVVEIGSELEKQKLAMKAILGDEGMANTISSQINTLAVKSPFGIMELNQYAKQLTAFQIPYNELYDTMKRMADVSAAVGVDMGRIILAYGQVRAAKFLKGTELRQFTEANIPLIDMLAERFTKLKGEIVSAGDIMDMISNKEVSFEDVKAVLWELTGEGGRFYNMQEVLSESVSAKWKNLADAIDLMFADIADSTSGPLKGLAEILTELTSRWSTIASVASVAAIAFGGVKVASLLTARSLDASGSSALKAAANSALLERNNARLAQGYRTLTRDERKALGTSLSFWQTQKSMLASLSGAQFRQLALTGQITKAEWERMIALGRLSQSQKYILNNLGILTTAEQNNIKVLKKSLLTMEGWKRAFLGVGNAARSVGRALGALFLNPVTAMMAAIGTVTALWQRNSEEMAKAKEIGDNIATSASEGFRNLKSSLEKMQPSEGLTDTQLTQGIEEMQQLIKNYSPTPIEDINNALVAQDGHIRTLIEQYDFLSERLKELKGAYFNIDNTFMGIAIEGALKATDGGNWFTQMFDDGIAENAKDYTNALGRVTDRIAKYSREYSNNMKSAINAATNADAGFKSATAGMESYEEKLRFLAENAELYHAASMAFDLDMNRWGYGEHIDYFSNANQIKAAREELLNDTDKFIADMNARLRQKGINPFLMTDQQKTELAIGLKSVLSQMEGAGEDAKALIAQKWEETWEMAGMIMEDKIGPSIQEKFRALVGESTAEGIVEISKKLKVEGYSALSDEERELVDRLMEEAKTQTMSELGIMNADMQKYLTAHPLNQIITLAFATDTSNLYKEIVGQKGYPGLTNDVDKYVSAWTKGNSVFDARNAAQSALQKAKSELDAAKEAGVGVEAAQKEWDKVNAALLYLGWTDITVKDQKSNKHPNESQKDPLAESLKQRFKDIKDAWSEFQKWSKTEGREAAAKRIGESGLFSTLSADKIPQTVEQYRALVVELENELRQAGVKGTARESLLNDLLKQLLDIDKTVVDEQLKLALDKVSKEAERQLADWNLFDKIRKATGDQDLAMSIAFGMNATTETDYPAMIKQQFNDFAKAAKSALTFDTATPELLANAPDEVKKAWEDATKKLQQYTREQKDAIADILNEYQSLQDKLTKIDADRERKIKTVNESDMSAPDKAKYIQRINVEADYQKFTQSADYLKFFSGIYSLTMEKAQEIGDKIRLHLDQRLQAGKISAEDYYKEIERINQQLSKLRNVKSDALTFLTGGVKGVQQKKLDVADSKVLDQMTKVQEAQEALEKAKASGDIKQIAAAELTLKLAETELETRMKIRDAIVKDMEGWQKVLDVVGVVNNLAGGMSDAFNTLRDMADSFGFDTESNAWETAAAVMDTLTTVTGGVQKVIQSAMSGDIGGIIGGAFDTLLTPFTIWNKLHDKKLQKMIDRSKEAAQIMQNQYDILEKRMANFLGNAANMKVEGYSGEGGAYGKQRELMQGQLAELEKQRQAEIDKKKTDDSVVADYDKQIEEMKIAIQDFAIEAANALYGIDLNGWAEQLGDSLVEAFAAGEDAAEAFDKTVGDIMRDVTSKMISQDILAPMFGDLRNFLFGENGMGGAFGADFKLDASEMASMKEYLDKIKNEGIPAAEELFNAINEATGGILNETDTAKSGLSAGIQSLTEDTGSLVASYCNGIRGDVSVQTHDYWPRLLDDALPQMNIIAQSQLDTQRQIAENTLRNAVAAEAIMKSNDDISRLLTRVAQGGAKWHV